MVLIVIPDTEEDYALDLPWLDNVFTTTPTIVMPFAQHLRKHNRRRKRLCTIEIISNKSTNYANYCLISQPRITVLPMSYFKAFTQYQ